MSDGFLETVIEVGIEVAVGEQVDQATGAALNDAAKAELTDVLSEVISEPLEDLVEDYDFFDGAEAVGEAFQKTLEVVDYLSYAHDVTTSGTYTPEQAKALIAFKVIENLTPWMTGSPTEVAQKLFEFQNSQQDQLDQLFNDYPDLLFRDPSGKPQLQLVDENGDPIGPPVALEDVDPNAPPATLDDLLKPNDPEDEVAPVASPVAQSGGAALGSINNTCPLILDLDGDGVAVSALGFAGEGGSEVFFDLDSDGFAERTAWVLAEGETNITGTGGDDAYLVRDVNENGVIDDESEMFCVTSVYANGFANLATLDENGDGRVDASDTDFADLQLWLDANGDGVTDAGELHALSDYSVAAISVEPTSLPETLLNGNLVTAEATFWRDDASTGTITDMWFTNDDLHTRYRGDYTLDPRMVALPTLRGYGDLTDLHVAASLDPDLLVALGHLQQDFTWELLADKEAFDARIEDILFRWAGVQELETDARGPHIDAQLLEFMEMFAGSKFGVLAGLGQIDPEGYWQADGIRAAYGQAFNFLKANLVAQLAGDEIFGEGARPYDFATGLLRPMELSTDGIANLRATADGLSSPADVFWGDVIRLLAQVQPLDTLQAAQRDQLAAAIVDTSDTSFAALESMVQLELSALNINGTEGPDHITGANGNDILNGLGGADLIEGASGRDALHGGGGDDDLRGGAGEDDIHGNDGDDVVTGGLGDDRVYGNAGNDIYHWDLGDGSDSLTEDAGTGSDGQDTIRFGTGIVAEDLTFRMDSYHLYIDIGSETLTVNYQFYQPEYTIETALFSDGSEVSLTGGFTLVGTDQADSMYAYEGRGIVSLEGKEGDDYLYGSSEDDIYIWNLGDGSDYLNEPGGDENGGADAIHFGAGITADDLSFRMDTYHLYIDIGAETLTINYQFYQPGYVIEKAVFDDGSEISLTSGFDLLGTEDSDSLTAYTGRGVLSLQGQDGNDSLTGSDDDDLLIGGAGNDYAYGNDGDDIYVWNLGDGSDYLNEPGGQDNAGEDQIRFGAGITADDLSFRMNTYNLYIDIGVETLTISYQFYQPGYVIEKAVFDDGSEISLTSGFDLLGTEAGDSLTAYTGRGVLSLQGLGGNDSLTGSDDDDLLIGGAGNDYAYGNDGDDIYVWNLGDGSDYLNEAGGQDNEGEDQIRFGAGITADDLSFRMDTYNLYIDIGAETLTINYQFYQPGYVIEKAVFDGGSEISLTGGFHVTGTDQDDSIQSYAGRDIVSLAGLAGNDYLYGSTEDDIYVWNLGDGSDSLNEPGGDENGGADIIQFGAGITADDLSFRMDTYHLYVDIGSETLTINYQFYQQGYVIEKAVFDDGSELSLTGGFALRGTDVSESLTSYDGRGVVSLEGLEGDDYLYGSSGDDVYIWNVGDGSDYITELNGTENEGEDVIRFGAGVSVEDLRYRMDTNQLYIDIGSETLTINYQYYLPGYRVETLEFADGSSKALGEGIALIGSNADETITSYSGRGVVSIEGSGGVDYLYGSTDADSYIWRIGDGSDYITESGGEDAIVLGDGIGIQDLRFRTDSYHLYVDIGAQTLTVQNHAYQDSAQVENILFSDGVRLSLTDDFAIHGTAQGDTIHGSDRDDVIYGDAGDDMIDGSDNAAGGDVVSYEYVFGAVEVYLNAGLSRGAAGKDTLISVENIVGTAFADRLVGDAQDNDLRGGDGNDIIKGKGGADTFHGGDGDDILRGGDGADVMYGGAGEDVLIALSGDDRLYGGEDRDFLYGGRDADTVYGDGGHDEVRGNLGNDMIFGGSGRDDLRGGGGHDDLQGDSGDDYLFGENGQDVLFGGTGDDSLTGGAGSGILDGRTDTFVYKGTLDGGGGFDRIKDWEDGIDQIDLTSFGFTDFSTDVAALASDRAGGVRLDFGWGDILFIEGFNLADLDASDVIL